MRVRGDALDTRAGDAVPAVTNTRLAPAYSLRSNDLPPTAALTPLAPTRPVSVVCPRFRLRHKARAFASKHARSIHARSRSASTADSSHVFRSGDPPKGTCHSLAAGHGAKRTTHGVFAPPQRLPIRSTATSSPPPSTCVSSFPPSLPAPSLLSSDFAHTLPLCHPSSASSAPPLSSLSSLLPGVSSLSPAPSPAPAPAPALAWLFSSDWTDHPALALHRTRGNALHVPGPQHTSILATVVSERHVAGALLVPAEVVSFVSADSGCRAGTLSRHVAGRPDAAPDASWWMAASVTPRRVRALRQHGQELDARTSLAVGVWAGDGAPARRSWASGMRSSPKQGPLRRPLSWCVSRRCMWSVALGRHVPAAQRTEHGERDIARLLLLAGREWEVSEPVCQGVQVAGEASGWWRVM
ncbi:hypothetical protein B0H10DRAFT_2217634 [Mycena sp. CBHHK59/15]|nr:hypothetical protein B0H10DRAFT_2217634 [Mycena sp. CBHHK59/15]